MGVWCRCGPVVGGFFFVRGLGAIVCPDYCLNITFFFFFNSAPRLGTIDPELKFPSAENTELSKDPSLVAWNRSARSFTNFVADGNSTVLFSVLPVHSTSFFQSSLNIKVR